jgi:hypothetical protein
VLTSSQQARREFVAASRQAAGHHLLTHGIFAVVRGAMNQPEAIKEHRAGKIWDQKERKWTKLPTNAVAIDDPRFAEARKRHFGNNAAVAATSATAFPHYYELLGVEARLRSFLLSIL